MLIEWFLSIKSLPNLLFGVLRFPGDQSHRFEQPTINPLACCICWAGLSGHAVFPPWNEGPSSGSYKKKKKIFRTFDYNITRKELIGKNLFICFYINPLSCMFYHSSPLFQTLSHVSDWQVNILKQKWKSKVCLLVEFCMDHLLVS